MQKLTDFLQSQAWPDGLPLLEAIRLSDVYSLSLAHVEETALENGIKQRRYIRNCFSTAEQLTLARTTVAIVGCGGLGGAAASLLARLGIGNFIVIDPDIYEEHNLNRQHFCTVLSLGQPKAAVLEENLADINPAADITAYISPVKEEHLDNCDIIIDGLDSAETRRNLDAMCLKSGKILIHGAVEKWYGQVGVAHSGNKLIQTLYPGDGKTTAPQVLAPTVYAIAAIQAFETCKALLDLPDKLDHSWLSCDFKILDFMKVPC